MKQKQNSGWRKSEVLLLLGLMSMTVLSAAGDQSANSSLGPQNGLVAYVARKGAKIRCLRQLPSPTSPLPSTTTRNNPSTSRPSNFSSISPSPSLATSTTRSTASPSTPTPASPVQKTAEVIVFVGELRELDGNGNKYRTFNAFDSQDFNISYLQFDYVIPNSRIHSDALTADALLPAPSFGHLSIDACVTKDNGTVTLGDEAMTLIKGQLKVNVGLKQRQWCDAVCTGGSQPTKYLEIDFVIQVAAGRSVKELPQDPSYGHPKRFSLGKDAWTDFSRKVFLDGSWLNLTDGYPKLSTIDSKNVITVRFPRFNSSVAYDVSFDPGNIPEEDKGGPVASANRFPQIYGLVCTCLFAALSRKVICLGI